MNPTAIAVLTRSATAAAHDTFQRIYPGTPSAAQLKVAQLAMAEAAVPAIRKFGDDARMSPYNTEAHYAAAVLAIVSAGVRAIAYTKPQEQAVLPSAAAQRVA
jgi:hypothetical protein